MTSRSLELRDFLRVSRAHVSPADVGLPVLHPRGRRVPGLRREEVAYLSGVSNDYYIRLEQGRIRQVSYPILDAIARTLRLNETEREYFFALLDTIPRRSAGPFAQLHPRPGLRRIMDSFPESPAIIVGRGMTVLAMNSLARILFFDDSDRPQIERNLAMWTFLDPVARERYTDWEAAASQSAAILRRESVAGGADHTSSTIIAELTARSEDFQRFWAEHKVFEYTYGRNRFRHPIVVGPFELDYEAFVVPESPGQKMIVYTAPAQAASEEALRQLANRAHKDAINSQNPQHNSGK